MTGKQIWAIFIFIYLSIYSFIHSFIHPFIYRQKWRREEEMERNFNVKEKHPSMPLTHALIGDWTCNPGMCPDRELNWKPFPLQDDTQPTEPLWSGNLGYFLLPHRCCRKCCVKNLSKKKWNNWILCDSRFCSRWCTMTLYIGFKCHF